MKRVNWRHKIPEAPQRKKVRAERKRLRPYGLTYMMRLNRRVEAVMPGGTGG